MTDLYDSILPQQANPKKRLALLLDPEKTTVAQALALCPEIEASGMDMVLVGGSGYACSCDQWVQSLRAHLNRRVPIVLFPGSPDQFTDRADALLLLSLISGRNPEMLIGWQVKKALEIARSGIEVIPTGYILIDGGKESAVERVSHTTALAQKDIHTLVSTAVAGELLGLKALYLEAGSGALVPVSREMIEAVKKNTHLPLFVGGGIRTVEQVKQAFEAGADIVVVGTYFEQHPEQMVAFGQQVKPL